MSAWVLSFQTNNWRTASPQLWVGEQGLFSSCRLVVGCIPIGDSFVLRNGFSDLKPSDVPKLFLWSQILPSTEAEAQFNEGLQILNWPEEVEAKVERCKEYIWDILHPDELKSLFTGTEFTEAVNQVHEEVRVSASGVADTVLLTKRDQMVSKNMELLSLPGKFYAILFAHHTSDSNETIWTLS